MGLGLTLVIAIAGIAVIITFGGTTNGSSEHSSDQSTDWQSHRSHTPSAGHGKNHHDSSSEKTSSGDDSQPGHVPEELWLAVAGLFGALVGLLVPTPRIKWRPLDPSRSKQEEVPPAYHLRFLDFSGFTALALLGVAIALIANHLGSPRMDGALVACATAALAIFIPSPARYDSV